MGNELVKVEGTIDSFVELSLIIKANYGIVDDYGIIKKLYKGSDNFFPIINFRRNIFPSAKNGLYNTENNIITLLTLNMNKLRNTSIEIYSKRNIKKTYLSKFTHLHKRIIFKEVHPTAKDDLLFVLDMIPEKFKRIEYKKVNPRYFTVGERLSVTLEIIHIKEQAVSFLEHKLEQRKKEETHLDYKYSEKGLFRLSNAIILLRNQIKGNDSKADFDSYLDSWVKRLMCSDLNKSDFLNSPNKKKHYDTKN